MKAKSINQFLIILVKKQTPILFMCHNLCLPQNPFCIYKLHKPSQILSHNIDFTTKKKQLKMLPQESLLEHKEMHDTTDELYDTLSLCDLPLYGDQSVEEWEKDLSADSQGSTSMSSYDHDDYFEFFSHELTHPTPCFPPENIIFCDKIIAYKQQPDASDALPTKEVDIKQPTGVKKKRGWSLFGWRFGTKCTSTTQTSKKKHSSSKQGKGYDFPLNKMPILTSSQSAKARWFLFLSGISRYSSKMELRDIKNRQSRRHSPNPQPSLTLRFQNQDEKVAGDTGRRSSGLWEIVRVLSCGGSNDPNSLVVGSISCNRIEAS